MLCNSIARVLSDKHPSIRTKGSTIKASHPERVSVYPFRADRDDKRPPMLRAVDSGSQGTNQAQSRSHRFPPRLRTSLLRVPYDNEIRLRICMTCLQRAKTSLEHIPIPDSGENLLMTVPDLPISMLKFNATLDTIASWIVYLA